MKLLKDKKTFFGLGILLAVLSVGVVYAAYSYGATLTSPVTITSTAILAPSYSVTTAKANGVSCVVTGSNPQTITCSGVSIGQGGSYDVVVTVTNSGTASGSVTASPSTPTLSGSTFILVSGTTTQIIAAGGGTGSWTFQYAAGQTTGSESVTVTLSGS